MTAEPQISVVKDILDVLKRHNAAHESTEYESRSRFRWEPFGGREGTSFLETSEVYVTLKFRVFL